MCKTKSCALQAAWKRSRARVPLRQGNSTRKPPILAASVRNHSLALALYSGPELYNAGNGDVDQLQLDHFTRRRGNQRARVTRHLCGTTEPIGSGNWTIGVGSMTLSARGNIGKVSTAHGVTTTSGSRPRVDGMCRHGRVGTNGYRRRTCQVREQKIDKTHRTRTGERQQRPRNPSTVVEMDGHGRPDGAANDGRGCSAARNPTEPGRIGPVAVAARREPRLEAGGPDGALPRNGAIASVRGDFAGTEFTVNIGGQ